MKPAPPAIPTSLEDDQRDTTIAAAALRGGIVGDWFRLAIGDGVDTVGRESMMLDEVALDLLGAPQSKLKIGGLASEVVSVPLNLYEDVMVGLFDGGCKGIESGLRLVGQF
jgi:hypothetical protein